jgi:hypothetical protein
MGQRWFVSLVPVQDAGAKAITRAILFVAVSSLHGGAWNGIIAPSFADEDPSPVISQDDPAAAAPTPTNSAELDQSFLLLPAYDLEMPQVQGQAQAPAIRVGDSITVHLQGDPQSLKSLAPALTIGWPQGTEDLTTSVALDEKTSGDDHHFRITFIKAGKVTIPSLGLGNPGDDAKKFIARTNPLNVDVATSIAKDDPKPKEAAPPLPPERLGFPIWTLIVGGILLLALIGAAIYGMIQWSKKRRLEEAKRPKGPPPTEDQVALEALKKLEAQGLLKKGDFKRFYFGISEILKHYIGARYKFDAVESTTDEMLSHLDRESGVQSHLLSSLKEMYERLDLVKFTDHRPVAIEGSELLEEARKVVNQTKRQIIIPSANSTNTSGTKGITGGKH